MYLSIAKNKVIMTKDIIGIFDLDNTTIAKDSRNFLANCEKNGEIETLSIEDLPLSFIVSDKKDNNSKQHIYLSPISASTLQKRLNIHEYDKV